MKVTDHELHGRRVAALSAGGNPLGNESDALDLIGTASAHDADMIVVPVDRFEEDVFDLSTRRLGEIVQKLVNYRVHLVIAGDLTQALERSRALRDFVGESNRGRQLWFVEDLDELARRLSGSRTVGR